MTYVEPHPDDDHLSDHIDTSVAHAARVYDHLLGGVDNFEVDRRAAERGGVAAGGIDKLRALVRANRAFLVRAVRFVSCEARVHQFLDIGTGIPGDGNVAAVARESTSDLRVVYVDKDPIVLAHAHSLLGDAPEGNALFVEEDLRNTEGVLHQAATTLDFDLPVALLLAGLLHHLGDTDAPHAVVSRLLDALPTGSYLVISHLAGDIQPREMAAVAARLDGALAEPWVPRSRAEVVRFFDGVELVAPGVVPVDQWRPDERMAASLPGWTNPVHAGVGRKP